MTLPLGSNKLLYMSYSLKRYLSRVLNEMKEPVTQGSEEGHSRQSKQYMCNILRQDQLWCIQEMKLRPV